MSTTCGVGLATERGSVELLDDCASDVVLAFEAAAAAASVSSTRSRMMALASNEKPILPRDFINERFKLLASGPGCSSWLLLPATLLEATLEVGAAPDALPLPLTLPLPLPRFESEELSDEPEIRRRAGGCARGSDDGATEPRRLSRNGSTSGSCMWLSGRLSVENSSGEKTRVDWRSRLGRVAPIPGCPLAAPGAPEASP